jgi:hypothetical protein
VGLERGAAEGFYDRIGADDFQACGGNFKLTVPLDRPPPAVAPRLGWAVAAYQYRTADA